MHPALSKSKVTAQVPKLSIPLPSTLAFYNYIKTQIQKGIRSEITTMSKIVAMEMLAIVTHLLDQTTKSNNV